MALDALADALPPYAGDLRANLLALLNDRDLGGDALWGCLLACAVAAGEPRTLCELAGEAGEHLGERGTEAAKAAAALTSMNSVYYGAVQGLRNPEYANSPSHLVMETLARPGADRTTFDLWCLSVAALTGCTPLLDALDTDLRGSAVPAARVQAAIRAAALVAGSARVLAAEAALDAGDEGARGGTDQEEQAMPKDDTTQGEDTGEGEGAPAPASPAGTADPAVTHTPHPAPSPGGVTPG